MCFPFISRALDLAYFREELIKEIWTPYLVYQYEANSITVNRVPCWCNSDIWYIGLVPTTIYHVLGKDIFLEYVNSIPTYMYFYTNIGTTPPISFPGADDVSITGHSKYGHPTITFSNPKYKYMFFEAIGDSWHPRDYHYQSILSWINEASPITEQAVEIANKLLDFTKDQCAQEAKTIRRRKDLYESLLQGVQCAKASIVKKNKRKIDNP